MQGTRSNDITGIILVGGKSRRMGRDKAFLRVGGRTLIDRTIELFQRCFTRVLLVGDRAERFDEHGLPVVPDIYPGSSLGGLYSGLYHAETEYIFLASCDLPFPNEAIVRHLCAAREGYDAVVPCREHGYEPLFALYSKRCLDPIKEQIATGDYCAYNYFPKIRLRSVPYLELASLDPEQNAFVNVNTPEELLEIGGES
ncbi:molybdenum cofactor guanylyltransferase [Geomonas sp. Red32]|uniref:molybdenum cofactor guanylyltransferase n=1 Tax=Geomonas sp. Red32 TaxID=2912856 RepID=UPI00202CF1FB|nr:molybdenum cofactor guanylyltransferase [Geomonas sp. Red32]MCM0082151.1 molybdenum cofactor guanylyltransferase [Geomonas sp. Red32]